MVRAGLKAIYLSGWQVAADANTAGAMYPDQSLYPANAAPELCKRINRTLQRADQIETSEGNGLSVDTWFAPIVADAEAGFGGPLNAFEIMKAFIEAGAAGVHYEDQLASEKKCGHLGGKVLIPTAAHIRNLDAARLAADVMGTPTLVVARTDAEAAKLLTSDIDERDQPFVDYAAGRTVEGFYQVRNGHRALHRARRRLCAACRPDLVRDLEAGPGAGEEIRRGVRRHHPGKLLAYNCSPSFNWKKNLDDATIASFQRELGAMGYKFQFITLAGFHQLNFGMFELARGYQAPPDGGLFGAAGGRVRGGGQRLHRDQAPARGRHRLFRRRLDGDHRRPVVDHRHARIHRAGSSSGRRRNRHDTNQRKRPTGIHKEKWHGTQNTRQGARRGTVLDHDIDQQAVIRMVANDLHRLNQSVMKAVEAGVSVELVRSARHHGGNGNWGDLLIPVVVTPIRGCLSR